MKKTPATYPKTYAVIVSYTVHGYRVGGQTRDFTPEEWAKAQYHHSPKRRWYYRDFTMKVLLDNGEELTLHRENIAYNGKRRGSATTGRKIKMYHHPRDTRDWRYKLMGE